MTNLSTELGVQSYCFRAFKKNEQVVAQLKQAGLDRIELCGAHVDFARPDTFDEIIGLYRQAGIAIVSIGVTRFRNDPAAERNYFEFARKAGARAISATFKPAAAAESFRTAEKLADEFDINLAIHNHGGRHWLGCSEMLEQVFATTGPRIGLNIDTAWALDSGEDPVKWVEKFGTRLYGVHLKDFVFDRARKPADVIVGSGNLDLPRFIAALRQVEFNGFAVLEYEGDVNDPLPAIRKCHAAVRTAWGK